MNRSLLRLLTSLCTFILLFAWASAQDLEGITHLTPAKNFRFSSTDKDWQHGNVDFRPVLPGKTYTLADIKGPGTIRRIWLTILPSEPAYSRLMTIRIYWDGEKNPSVECPLGDFFGVGHGVDQPLSSLPVRDGADGRARTCFWVMPFRKSARVTLTNDGTLATWCLYYQVDGQYERVAANAPYFHVSYRQEFPCRLDRNYTVADIRGEGSYVGSVVSVRSTSDGWYGEGNDYFFVDGDKTPTLGGTGFEDYFGEAWGLRIAQGNYSGCTFLDGWDAGARESAYRWHVPDPIRFTKSLRVEIQDMGQGKSTDGKDRNDIRRADEFSSAAFWYQTGEHLPYPALPLGYDRLPFDYRRFVEAESLPYPTPKSGKVEVKKINGLHGDHELEWSDPAAGDQLDLPFEVDKSGVFQVMVLTSSSDNGGSGEFLVDGKSLKGSTSFHTGDFEMHHEVTLAMGELSAGKHTLSLKVESGSWFAVDGFIVQPLRTATDH